MCSVPSRASQPCSGTLQGGMRPGPNQGHTLSPATPFPTMPHSPIPQPHQEACCPASALPQQAAQRTRRPWVPPGPLLCSPLGRWSTCPLKTPAAALLGAPPRCPRSPHARRACMGWLCPACWLPAGAWRCRGCRCCRLQSGLAQPRARACPPHPAEKLDPCRCNCC